MLRTATAAITSTMATKSEDASSRLPDIKKLLHEAGAISRVAVRTPPRRGGVRAGSIAFVQSTPRSALGQLPNAGGAYTHRRLSRPAGRRLGRAGCMETEQPFGEHARRARRVYGAAADHYTLAPLGFWDRFGSATVSRLRLAPGMAVLDLCCGAGGSAIPAAHAVGAAGRVLGIDVAAPLLDLARARAAREGLSNIEFRHGDATRTGLLGGSFDAVVCVFGVFFAPDMTAFVQEMWRLVRPGGVLAVTTWGPGLFEPANSCFWRCVGEVEPSLYKNFNPWDEITTPAELSELLTRAGVPRPAVVAAEARHHLEHPDSFWDIVLGSGYRATVDALSPDQRDHLRESLLAELRSRECTVLQTDVVYGTASR